MTMLNERKFICLMPWLSINIGAFNKYSPCSSIDSNFSYEKEVNAEQAWRSQSAGNLRYQFLTNQQPEPCFHCFNSEKFGPSPRTKFFDLQVFELPTSIDKLAMIKSPQIIIIEIDQHLIAQDVILKISPLILNIKKIILRGNDLASHPVTLALLTLITNNNLHDLIEINLEFVLFDNKPASHLELMTFSKLKCIYHLHALNLDDLNFNEKINVLFIVQVDWFNIFDLSNFLLKFSKLLNTQFEINITSSNLPYSIINLPNYAKSEIAYQLRQVELLKISKINQFLRQILEALNLESNKYQLINDLNKIRENNNFMQIKNESLVKMIGKAVSEL